MVNACDAELCDADPCSLHLSIFPAHRAPSMSTTSSPAIGRPKVIVPTVSGSLTDNATPTPTSVSRSSYNYGTNASATPSHIGRLIGQYESQKQPITPAVGRSFSTSSAGTGLDARERGAVSHMAMLSPAASYDRRLSAPPLVMLPSATASPSVKGRANSTFSADATTVDGVSPPTVKRRLQPPPIPSPTPISQASTSPTVPFVHTPTQSSLLSLPQTLFSLPAPASPRTPNGKRHKGRTGSIDDAAVEAAGSYVRNATSPRGLTITARSPQGVASPTASGAGPDGSPSKAAAIRHKLQTFRTLPMNLPSSSPLMTLTLPEESKTHESYPSASPTAYADPSSTLSPTHFSYWEKRNIWVQREREEMLAKVNLKKVLRKINEGGLIVRGGERKWGVGSGSNGHNASPQPPPLPNSTPRSAKSDISPQAVPSPPRGQRSTSLPPTQTQLNLPPPAAARLSVVSPPAASSPAATAMASVGSPQHHMGVATPSPQFPAITISELSTAASNLNLTGQMGRVEFARDCAQHLSKMEHYSCTFTSAPQLMWALKALTLTEDDAARDRSSTLPAPSGSPSSSPVSSPLPGSPSSYASLSQLKGSQLFRRKREAVEAIIKEQGFAPEVVQYIRAHALVPQASSTLRRVSLTAGSRGPPPIPAATPGTTRSTSEPPHLHPQLVTSASSSGDSSESEPVPPPVPAFPSQVREAGHKKGSFSVANPARRESLAAGAKGNALVSASSTRSNSLQTELDYEWSRRRIPKVKLQTIRGRVEAKLKEEVEELEEKRAILVEKVRKLNIWQPLKSAPPGTNAVPSEESILSSLSLHRFDLLRFTFELTELQEMEGRAIRFSSLPQAMASLRILYDKMSQEQIDEVCREQQIPAHVQAYLEARRNEIANSREEKRPVVPAAASSHHLPPGQPKLSPNPSASTASSLSPRPPPSPLSPTASPLAHHRSISLVEFVEVLSSGNLIQHSPSSSIGERLRRRTSRPRRSLGCWRMWGWIWPRCRSTTSSRCSSIHSSRTASPHRSKSSTHSPHCTPSMTSRRSMKSAVAKASTRRYAPTWSTPSALPLPSPPTPCMSPPSSSFPRWEEASAAECSESAGSRSSGPRWYSTSCRSWTSRKRMGLTRMRRCNCRDQTVSL